MKRRHTRLLSAQGLIAFGLTPAFLALGLITLSRFVMVAGHCMVSSGHCP